LFKRIDCESGPIPEDEPFEVFLKADWGASAPFGGRMVAKVMLRCCIIILCCGLQDH
jgi:hypothetical protein